MKSLNILDLKISRSIHQLGLGTWFDKITLFFSNIPLLTISWVMIGLFILFLIPDRTFFLCLALAAILHFVITQFLFKTVNIFPKKPRPYLQYPDLFQPLGYHASDNSFPSGHASFVVAAGTVIIGFYPYLWPLIIFYCLVVSYSRVHNSMHYLSDVLAGLVLGLIYGALAILIVTNFL